MSERAPYSRVYWTIVDDEKFDRSHGGVYDDDHHLATWLRLLIAADQAWPASANLPANARKGSLEVLVKAGLVDLVGSGRYRIHGLDEERGKRREAATRRRLGRDDDEDPTGPQAVPNWVPTGDQTGLRGKAVDETRRDETQRDTPLGRVIDTFLLARHRLPTERQKQMLGRYLEVFEMTGEQRAIQLILAHPDDPVGALIGDIDAEMTKRKQAAASQEAESKSNRKAAGFRPGTPEYELLEHWMKGDAA